MKPLYVGVVGTGKFGTYHCQNFKNIKYCRIAGVYDKDIEKAENLSKNLGIPFTKTLNELINRCEALTVCTPTSTHYKIAKKILSAKKHCLVEKPLTLSMKEAYTLEKISRKNKVSLQTGHIERFNAAFQTIRKIIKNPVFIEIHRLNLFPGRSLDISVVMDLMIHDIDIALGLVNSEIKTIEAIGVKILTSQPDIAQTRITFKNGCVANITASRISDEVLRKLRIFTRNIYASVDYKSQDGHIYKKTKNKIARIPLNVEKSEPLRKELEEFVLCCLGKKKPSFYLKDALKSLEVALEVEKNIRKYEKNILNIR